MSLLCFDEPTSPPCSSDITLPWPSDENRFSLQAWSRCCHSCNSKFVACLIPHTDFTLKGFWQFVQRKNISWGKTFKSRGKFKLQKSRGKVQKGSPGGSPGRKSKGKLRWKVQGLCPAVNLTFGRQPCPLRLVDLKLGKGACPLVDPIWRSSASNPAHWATLLWGGDAAYWLTWN